jgi:hypothetical protein
MYYLSSWYALEHNLRCIVAGYFFVCIFEGVYANTDMYCVDFPVMMRNSRAMLCAWWHYSVLICIHCWLATIIYCCRHTFLRGKHDQIILSQLVLVEYKVTRLTSLITFFVERRALNDILYWQNYELFW